MKNKNCSGAVPVKFQLSFLAPRFWGTWLLLGLLRLMMVLPRRWVMFLGARAGDYFRRSNRKRRRIAEVNFELCFPELTAEERNRLLVEHFHTHGRCMMDMGLALWGSEKRLKKLVQLEGFEEQRKLVAEKNVLAITWHLTTMELCGLLMTMAGSSVSMMKLLKNPLLNWVIARGRGHMSDLDLVPREAGIRPLIKGLKSGRQCILLPDEDFGFRGGDVVYVPFFGVPRAMLTTPGRIAKATGAVITVCATRLDPATGKYYGTFTPPLTEVKGDDPVADAKAICSAMESLIRQAPEQYLWTFRWFHSRPDGDESPYDPVFPVPAT
ncbi:lysophospholipid acyltransferase family protein [Microbulbifer sp. Q7]|uniref:lysophospholipid acyltransferase family protein n=1 Tax=Microbulbifer sp. Q7 TaxID=1785091 RepID=UPI000834AA9B|nr:lysophospholipid acyltransferase family protein [Microbulbifer sp. Q7]